MSSHYFPFCIVSVTVSVSKHTYNYIYIVETFIRKKCIRWNFLDLKVTIKLVHPLTRRTFLTHNSQNWDLQPITAFITVDIISITSSDFTSTPTPQKKEKKTVKKTSSVLSSFTILLLSLSSFMCLILDDATIELQGTFQQRFRWP